MREKIDKLTKWLVSFGTDKYIHLLTAMIVAFVAAFIFSLFGLHRAVNGLAGIVVGVIVSLAKEVYDEETTGLFDMKDLAADFIGLALFYVIHVL